MLRYILELSGAFLIYGLSLLISAYAVSHFDWTPQNLIWPYLIPLPSTLLVCWVIWHNLRKMDEMQIRQQLEALGIAFALTGLLP